MSINLGKGTAILFIRENFRKLGPVVENRFLDQLSPDEIRIYHQSLAVTWVPTDISFRLLNLAAPLLFPDDPIPNQRLGYETLLHDFKGIYRFLIRIPSVPFVLGQTSRIWSTYNKKGKAWAQKINPTLIHVFISDFPELPPGYRQYITGSIRGLLDLLKLQNNRVVELKNDQTPEVWIWELTWEEEYKV